MPCPNIAGCPLYPQFKLQSLLQIWKINYCESEYTECARFKRSRAGEPVPANMLPNGKLLDTEPPTPK